MILKIKEKNSICYEKCGGQRYLKQRNGKTLQCLSCVSESKDAFGVKYNKQHTKEKNRKALGLST